MSRSHGIRGGVRNRTEKAHYTSAKASNHCLILCVEDSHSGIIRLQVMCDPGLSLEAKYSKTFASR